MALRGLAVVAAVAHVAAQITPPQYPCLVSFNGASYNLDNEASSAFYTTQDSRNNGGPLFMYYFGVCRDVSKLVVGAYCSTHPQDAAPAWRVCISNCGSLSASDKCVRLGDSAANLGWSSRPWDIAAGVSFNYTNGDSCGQAGLNYSVQVNFDCHDTPGLVPAMNEVIRDTSCQYHINVRSRAGCPTQCANDMQLGMCSGSGVCDYDTSKGRARCFCDLGSSGASCESSGDKGLPPSTNYSPIITGGFFGSLFGGIIIAVGCLALRTRLLGGEFKDLFSVGLTGCGVGGGVAKPTPAYASGAPVLAYEAPLAAAPAPLFSGSASGGYVPPEAGDGPLLS